ncbi:MAG TPA: lipoyl(octanoyl) transferase LipB [Aggregatilineales bacterium]|nr:lipoyl(octanoyl) transferase LipB [Aggregatilineales bacterium]
MRRLEEIQSCQVISLGLMEYTAAWAIQERFAESRGADESPDTMIFVEHPHTYTLGSSTHAENILYSPQELADRGIAIHTVNRGGDVTYHGPGQLVGYPILKLPAGGDGLHADVVAYVRLLEQTLIAALETYGITAYAYPGYTGVWLDGAHSPEKIAAIGVKVNTKRVTLHGFALNVNTDLDYFKGIIPCGISDKPVTSVAKVLGHPVELAEVAQRVSTAFGTCFGRTMVAGKR